MLKEDEAFVLFVRPQGESSLWLSVFTEQHGRVSMQYKGGQKHAASCVPFQPYHLNWQLARAGLPWLRAIESVSFYPRLTGIANWSGLYLNQLCQSALQDMQAYPDLFRRYRDCVTYLSRADAEATMMAICLRRFEWHLLQQLGYGFPDEDCHGQRLNIHTHYQWLSDGWQPIEKGILGSELVALLTDEPLTHSSPGLRQLLQWRLSQVMPAQAMLMRQWWEEK